MKPFFLLSLLLFLVDGSLLAQDDSSFIIKQLPPDGVVLDKDWKYQAGDDAMYAQPQFDDSRWQPIDPTKDIRALPELWKTAIGWFRLHIIVDSAIAKEPIGFYISQTGASEIYLNGRLIQTFGTIAANPKQVQAATPVTGSFIPFPVSKSGVQVLAVRFAVQRGIPYINFAGNLNSAFFLQAMPMQQISDKVNSNNAIYFIFIRVGLFLLLSILHLALYRFDPLQKANLWFFLYAILMANSEWLVGLVDVQTRLTSTKMFFYIAGLLSSFSGTVFFLLAVYKTFHYKIKLIFWCVIAVAFLSMLSFATYNPNSFWAANVFVILPLLEIIRVTLLATRARQRGANIVIAGAINFFLFFILFNLFVFGFIPAGPNWLWGNFVFNIGWMSLPVSMSIYLALQSSYASRTLAEKLVEVQQLSQEKQQILSAQKEVLEQQVEQRTAELKHSLQELKATQAQLIQSEKMASLGELTAGIAHEIQNPLNFVNNFSETNTELLQEMKAELDKASLEEAKRIATDVIENERKINAHGKRADAIVKSMMEHSRISKGERQETGINILVDEYLRLAYHGYRAKDKSFNVNMETRFDESIGKINMVPQDVGRVLINLFNNAFYAVNKKQEQLNGTYKPTVTICTQAKNNNIQISVKDNGMGISKSLVEKIFQPFFTTKPTGEGTGLGLSLSYDIIKAHGGALQVNSEEGSYTEFIVQLPRT